MSEEKVHKINKNDGTQPNFSLFFYVFAILAKMQYFTPTDIAQNRWFIIWRHTKQVKKEKQNVRTSQQFLSNNSCPSNYHWRCCDKHGRRGQ